MPRMQGSPIIRTGRVGAIALAAWLGACSSTAPATPSGDTTRVVVYGHGYTLFSRGEREPCEESVLDLFVAEVNRIDPVAVFGLGDHTQTPRDEEWQLLADAMRRIRAPKYLVRGNHELLGVPDEYYEIGGSREFDRIVDIGASRFVLLDVRQKYEAAHLRFIESAVAGHETRAQTFVMMHYAQYGYAPLEQAPPGVDPLSPYNAYSNWNQDVVPLLDGKVDAIFCGDAYERLVGLYESPTGLRYIRVGFPFIGRGPVVMLELTFRGDELQGVLPRALPIDMREPWHRGVFPASGRDADIEWGRHLLDVVGQMTPTVRSQILSEALQRLHQSQAWQDVAQALRLHAEHGFEATVADYVRFDEVCWTTGLDAARTTSEAARARVFVTNPNPAPAVVRLHWSAPDSDAGAIRFGAGDDPGTWDSIRFDGAAGSRRAVVEFELSQNGAESIGVEGEGVARVRLERVEIEPR